MNEQPMCQIVACVPTDKQLLKFVNDGMIKDGHDPFVPTIEHSITTCEFCGQDVWIGPTQKQMANSVLFATKVVCYFCIAENDFLRESGPDNMVAVNPSIKNVRPRY